MKFLVVLSFVVFAVANPLDNNALQAPKTYPINDKQISTNPIPLNSAPLSPSTVDLHPLNKRDTPSKQTESQKNQQTVAVPVAQKVDNTKIVDTNRKTRDTVQKNTPTNLTPSNTQPQKTVDPVKPQKVSTVPENIRKTRDTVQKNTPTNLTPSNTQPQKTVDPVKTQKVDILSQNTRKTRETVKTDEVKKTLTDSTQKTSSVVTSAPQVVRIPLINARSRRETSNDQSKPIAANVKTETNLDKTKVNAPSSTVTESKPKRDSQANNSQFEQSDNLGTTGLKRPVPVDQILRRKPATTTDAPALPASETS